METRIVTATFESMDPTMAAVVIDPSARGGKDADTEKVLAGALKASGFEHASKNAAIRVEPARPGNDELHRLPAALGMLAAAGVVNNAALENTLCIGGLGVNGELSWTRGLYPAAVFARLNGLRLIAPAANEAEVTAAGATGAVLADTLDDLVDQLGNGRTEHVPAPPREQRPRPASETCESAKRVVQMAAAGRHHLILVSAAPMPVLRLVRDLPALWPAPTADEETAIRRIYSLAGLRAEETGAGSLRPFRAPHHTASLPALCGRTARESGTDTPGRTRPGEFSLAHTGVLVVDEIEQWSRAKLEALAYAMSAHKTVAGLCETPARCLVIGTRKPPPEGREPESWPPARLGPAAERFQMAYALSTPGSIATADGRRENQRRRQYELRIAIARQRARYGREVCNGEVGAEEFARKAEFTAGAREQLAANGDSPAGAAARVARTIADLHDRIVADAKHVTEAQYYATPCQAPVP